MNNINENATIDGHGRLVRSWGPFRYYEDYGRVQVLRDGEESTSRVSLQGDGLIVVEAHGREVWLETDGTVGVQQPHGQGDCHVYVRADGTVAVDKTDGSTIVVHPDGRVEHQSVEEVSETVTSLIPAEPSAQIDWVAEQLSGGRDFTKAELAQAFAEAGLPASPSTVQRRLREARALVAA